MADINQNVKASDLVREITVNIHIRRYRQAMWRIKAARLVIQLAVLIGGFGGVHITEDNDGSIR